MVNFQIGFTSIKVFLIIGFCLCAFTITPEPQPISFLPQKDDFKILTSTAFGISLIYVSYAYTGWNAAVYITSELERPQKELPKILLIGTATVMVSLFYYFNIAFLYSSPIADLEGKTEIGYIAAVNIFGSKWSCNCRIDAILAIDFNCKRYDNSWTKSSSSNRGRLQFS